MGQLSILNTENSQKSFSNKKKFPFFGWGKGGIWSQLRRKFKVTHRSFTATEKTRLQTRPTPADIIQNWRQSKSRGRFWRAREDFGAKEKRANFCRVDLENKVCFSELSEASASPVWDAGMALDDDSLSSKGTAEDNGHESDKSVAFRCSLEKGSKLTTNWAAPRRNCLFPKLLPRAVFSRGFEGGANPLRVEIGSFKRCSFF